MVRTSSELAVECQPTRKRRAPKRGRRIAGAVHGKVEAAFRTRPAPAPRGTRPASPSPGPPQSRFVPRPDWPSPQSQSFSRSYGSNLPTSLTYIVLSTRSCSPRRPAADMGTARHEINTVSVGFSRADESAPDTARAAVLYGADVPISGQAASREGAPYKEKRTLLGAPADVPHFVCVAARGRWGHSPCPGSGILTRFPFDR